MIYSIDFISSVSKAIAKFKKSNPNFYKKLEKILVDIQEHPRIGIGHPEPLKGGDGITYSRHITAHDRVIYDIYDEIITVIVVEVEGHYNDK